MDKKSMCQNMNLKLEENQDVHHEMYETLNMGTILEPRSCE
jgi:hypothetical protein